MRSWLSTRLIRMARRINPPARVNQDMVFHVQGDPLEAFRRVEDRARAYRLGHLR